MSGRILVDAAIAGGGIIGLSLGLELRRRGITVVVIDRQRAMSSASAAAGGMLAVMDPQNPPELMPLAERSRELYPEYLERIEELSDKSVPMRTDRAMQFVESPRPSAELVTTKQLAEYAPGLNLNNGVYEWLHEGSIDPKDLCEALPVAFVAAGGVLLEGEEVLGLESNTNGVYLWTTVKKIYAGMFVNCRGAWAGNSSLGLEALPVYPIKGQMANLRCEPDRLRCVVRAPGIYLIPRGDGRVTIGSTIEEAGFDETAQESSMRRLADAARALLPEAEIPAQLDIWAGLRPGTPDGLPILGQSEKKNCWHATGHYRDGILLGPATARAMAQAMMGEVPDVGLDAYKPSRF
jgi:glycine oxidase